MYWWWPHNVYFVVCWQKNMVYVVSIDNDMLHQSLTLYFCVCLPFLRLGHEKWYYNNKIQTVDCYLWPSHSSSWYKLDLSDSFKRPVDVLVFAYKWNKTSTTCTLVIKKVNFTRLSSLALLYFLIDQFDHKVGNKYQSADNDYLILAISYTILLYLKLTYHLIVIDKKDNNWITFNYFQTRSLKECCGLPVIFRRQIIKLGY